MTPLSIYITCRSRPDVLAGTIAEADFAADLAGREEAAYRLGMAMHRKKPRRVLTALRVLLTTPKPGRPCPGW